VADKFLTAADLGTNCEDAEFKTVIFDAATGSPAAPNGSMGFRWNDSGIGRWNLELGDLDPALSLHGRAEAEPVAVDLPRFDVGATEGGQTMRRGVPAIRLGGRLVTTVFDLVLAQYGVARDGLAGDWPSGYDDATVPYTPAWQQQITSVPAKAAARVAREFARNAERTQGRSMIAMGAGTNHWFHSDQTYRTFLSLVMMCGCEGVNGGGWAHYVGQEKVRPLTGWFHLAFGFDWQRPTRHMAGTPLWYLATDQWRYETFGAGELASPLGRGLLDGRSLVDCNALAARLGWTPSHPTFNRNPLDLADEADAAGQPPGDYIVDQLQQGTLRFAAEDPDDPANWPRVLTVWRANLFASSMKGHEYMLKHLLGTDNAVSADETPPDQRPAEVAWHDDAPRGKLDLSVALDFRMTSTCLFSDIVLPAATWYEKYDLSSTDMHPFVHSFNPAIAPPWEARTDFDTFHTVAADFSRLAAKHLGTRRDVIAAPLAHDSPDELAQTGGRVADWKAGECDPVPGKTMPKLVVVERDYAAVAEKLAAIGPLLDELGTSTKGTTWFPDAEIDDLRSRNGVVRSGTAAGRPRLSLDRHFCEAILGLSGTTNGRLAVEAFHALEQRTGVPLADLAHERAGDRIDFADTQNQPQEVITSPEWSGSESGGRRYAPFTVNVERRKPWHTLTGRQQFFLDHDWMTELGEALPGYRPPLVMGRHFGDQGRGDPGRPEVTVRYLTPHSKWSIHSEYQENLHMLTLFRGGPVIWLNPAEASRIQVSDNEWIEAFNRNGVVACRAVVSHRIPPGTCFMYHTLDRHLDVPKTEISGRHGGGDNSLTRLMMKPTHLIGGYGQFSYGFNYYGPTASQRDEVTVIRRRSQHVEF
jgi:nitrate reductase alpha subunit